MQSRAMRCSGILAGCILALTPVLAGADNMTTAPAASPVTDIDLLGASPYIIAGQSMVRVKGRLKNVVVDRNGEVVGLILDKASMHGTTDVTDMAANTMATGDTLIRVPLQSRQACGKNDDPGVTPVAGWSWVEVLGYPEAPRLYSPTMFAWRIAATAITVDDRSVGVKGFAKRKPRGEALLNFNLFGGNTKDESLPSNTMGYSVLSP